MSIPEKIKSQDEQEKLVEALVPFALFWVALKANVNLNHGDLYMLDSFAIDGVPIDVTGADCEKAYEAIKDRMDDELAKRGFDVV